MENVWIYNWDMKGLAGCGNDTELKQAPFVLWVNLELIKFQQNNFLILLQIILIASVLIGFIGLYLCKFRAKQRILLA